jgi:hypothetical protein
MLIIYLVDFATKKFAKINNFANLFFDYQHIQSTYTINIKISKNENWN